MKGSKKLTKTIERRKLRVRKHTRGSSTKPRMCVIKTLQHIYVQLIDDIESKTLAAISTMSKELKGTEFQKKNKQSARNIGTLIAKKAKELGIETVVFDRGRASYHGILAEVADGARGEGLRF